MKVNGLPRDLDALIVPLGTMFKHGVEDRKQLAHAGCESQFLRLTSGQQPLVEGTDDGVVPGCHQSSHVQRGTNPGSSTPYRAATPQAATIPIERRHTDQGGDLLAVQRAQFR